MEKRHIGFEIKLADNLIKRSLEATKPKELDMAPGCHSFALRFFAENTDRDIFQKDFEEKFSIRRSTATKILQLMEKNGLIERKKVENDARLKKIVLTKKALDIHNKAVENIEVLEQNMLKGISREEIENFLKVLDKIKLNLEESNV